MIREFFLTLVQSAALQLPPSIYSVLEEAQFEPLINALRHLYKEWL